MFTYKYYYTDESDDTTNDFWANLTNVYSITNDDFTSNYEAVGKFFFVRDWLFSHAIAPHKM